MTDHCDVQTFFWVWTKLLPLHGCDVMPFGVMCLWFDLLSSDVASCEVICGTTPVLLCTTKNYNVLLQYYSNVLLQYYPVLQSTTPVLCTTKYYASTTLYYKVLQRTTPVLLCTTKYYSSTTLYYKVLRQYYSVLQSTTPVLLQYSVLQSTTPVLLCTTKYYNVLLQYYSVLQSTTPVLLCTTKYYSSTTLYYKVLLQYYSVLLCTTKYYASTTLYYATTTYYSGTTLKRHLQCAEQVKSPSNLTKYCACHAKWMSSMICVTYETSFPMRGARKVTLQPHQIVHLPRKMNVINDLRHIWNVISNAWSKQSHPPTSPNTAPATQNECHQWSASHMKRHFQCVEQVSHPPTSPNSAPATQNECHQWSASPVKRHFQCAEQVKSPNSAPAMQNECHQWSASLSNVISNAWSK